MRKYTNKCLYTLTHALKQLHTHTYPHTYLHARTHGSYNNIKILNSPDFTPIDDPNASICSDIWKASSRVGVKIKANIFWGLSRSACRMGSAKAPVLPDPVSASPMLSFPGKKMMVMNNEYKLEANVHRITQTLHDGCFVRTPFPTKILTAQEKTRKWKSSFFTGRSFIAYMVDVAKFPYFNRHFR